MGADSFAFKIPRFCKSYAFVPSVKGIPLPAYAIGSISVPKAAGGQYKNVIAVQEGSAAGLECHEVHSGVAIFARITFWPLMSNPLKAEFISSIIIF